MFVRQGANLRIHLEVEVQQGKGAKTGGERSETRVSWRQIPWQCRVPRVVGRAPVSSPQSIPSAVNIAP